MVVRTLSYAIAQTSDTIGIKLNVRMTGALARI
jgi:hypothetical protein